MSEDKDKREDKGRITADISDDAVRDALRSVERQKAGGSGSTLPPAHGAGDSGSTLPPAHEAEPAAEAPPGSEAEPSPEYTELKAELEKTQAVLEDSQRRGREMMDKLRDTHERMLRAAADLENYKKRANREKDEMQKFGIEKLVRESLPVLDNLDRALEAAQKTRDIDALVQGVQLVHKMFESTLAKFGVEKHSALGKPFDPAMQEAMMQQETADAPPGTVVGELAKGYTLHGRLIRPAAVVVAKAPAESGKAEGGGPSEPAEPAGPQEG